MRSSWRDDRGISLIETLVALILMTLVVASFYGMITVAAREWKSLEGRLDVQQHPRVAADRVTAELRQSRDFVIDAAGTTLALVKVTLLDEDINTGAATFAVEDGSVLAAGVPLVLISVNRLERRTVSAIGGANGTIVTLTAGVTRPHKRGELVRRAQSTLGAAASSGATSLLVTNGSYFKAGNQIAVEDDGPFSVTAVAGNTLTIAPGLGQDHPSGDIVQPLTVVFKLAGTQLTRCTASCQLPANQVPVADLITAPPGRQVFEVVRSALTGTANVGDTQVCVASAVGFAVNDLIQIDREGQGNEAVTLPDRRQVVGVNIGTNCLTLDHGLSARHFAGAPVRVNTVAINLLASQFNPVVQQMQQTTLGTRAGPRD